MKKIVISTLLGLVLGMSPIIAQNSRPQKGSRGAENHSGDRVTRRLEMLKKDLALTDDQTAKVKSALETHQQKMDSGKSSSSESDWKTLRDNADAELDTTLKGILNEDQYSKYKAKQAVMKNHKGGEGRGK